MPFYDFQCEECGRRFEVHASIQQKMAGLEPECPRCHSPKVRQLVTAGLVIRGGSGPDSSGLSGCGPLAGPGCCGG